MSLKTSALRATFGNLALNIKWAYIYEMRDAPIALLRESTLRELITLGAVTKVQLVGCRGGFTLAAHHGDAARTLASTRGGVRQFASLNTAADFVRRLGLTIFEVDSGNYQPGRTRAPRPDRSEALKRTRTRPQQQLLI